MRVNRVTKVEQSKQNKKGEDNGNQIKTHGWRKKEVKRLSDSGRNNIQDPLSVLTYFIGKLNTQMFVWKWLHTFMALVIALLTLSILDIETLIGVLIKVT